GAALRYRAAETPETPAGGGRAGGALLAAGPTLVAPLDLDEDQRAALDRDLAAMRERMQQRRAAGGQGAAPGGPASPGGVMVVAGGNGAPSPEAMQQAMYRRMLEGFAGFRASLDEARRGAFDQRSEERRVGEACRARRAA